MEKACSQLLDHLQSLDDAKRSDGLAQFSLTWNSESAESSSSLANSLLLGTTDRNGLLVACGRGQLGSSDMKTSAVQALELFCKLVRSDKAVRNALPRIKIENFMSMKLERHILHSFHRSEMYPGSKSAPFDALLLLTESIPDLRLENVISGKEAQDIWQRWESAKEAESLQSSFNKPSEHDDKMVSEIKLNVGQSNDVVAQIKGANMKLLRRRRRSSQIYENIVPDAKTWNSFDADILSLDEDVIDLEQELEGVVPNQENEAFELGEDGMGSDPLGIIPGIISFPESCDRSSGLSSKLNDSRPLSPHRAARKPLASPNPYVEEFDPVLFIKEKHFDTSYNDLVKGLEHLKETMVSRQTQMRTFVQAHFDHFVNCKNTIDSIQGHCIRELDSPECSKTGKLHKKIVRMHEEVNNLYRPLLEREAEASRIRNVLNSLKRFDFIFSLPGSLLYNIETEQYDKAVRDYQKFANMKETEVPFLKKVLNYVMEIVEKFRATLRSQLENPNLLLEDQERTIQILQDLDCAEDPAWLYLTTIFEWICESMKLAYSKYSSENISQEGSFKSESDAKENLESSLKGVQDEQWNLSGHSSPISLESPKNSIAKSSIIQKISSRENFQPQNGMSTSEKHRNSLVVPMERHISPVDYVAKDHSSRILVQTLSFILRQRIHLFWKFSKSFSSGKFLRDSGDSLGLKSAQSRSKELCKRIISTYSMFIRNAIIYVENSLTSEATVRSIRIPPSISESLCEVYKTYYFLKSLEIPDAYLHELWHTMEEGTNLFVKDVFHQTLSEVTILYRQETWIPHRDIPGISLLVDNFKMIIQGALSKIEPIRQNSPSTSKWLLDLATPHLLEAFRAFADSIHAIAFHSSPPITSRHLCILLRNTEFSRDSLLPDIWESFQIHLPQDFSPEIHGAFSEVIELFQNLESLLLDAYLCSKSLRITCVLRRGMLMSGKSPNTPVQFVYEARSFVMEVLLELVMVHEEFTTLAIDGGNFEVLTHLVDRIIDVLVDSMERLGEISVGLSVQLASELRLIQHVCVRFLSPSARRSLDELQSRVESMISDSNSERVEKVFRDSLRSSGLVHASLRPDVARRASIADLIH